MEAVITLTKSELMGMMQECARLGAMEYVRQCGGTDLSKMPHLLTKKEAADILGMSSKTINRRIKSGDLNTKYDGRKIRVTGCSLVKLLK